MNKKIGKEGTRRRQLLLAQRNEIKNTHFLKNNKMAGGGHKASAASISAAFEQISPGLGLRA
jgi:hypothetical protein